MGLFDFLKKKPNDPTPAVPGAPAALPSTPSTPAPAGGSAPVAAGASPSAGTAPAAASAAATGNAPAAGNANAAGAPSIEVMDAFGRRMRIGRDEYRSKILPDLLKANGSNPDQLVGVILQAVRDGLAADVLPAANRLTIVDKDVERALSVLAIVQRDCGELDLAEATLRELQQKKPQSAAARVGLGMLAEARGDAAKAEALLWEALQLDCNHADAVHGWLQLRHRAVGDAGYPAELEKAASLPGAWRAPLWRARLLLQQGKADEAAAIYRDVIARAGGESDALVMASADLVQAQQATLVAELIVPRFQPGRHHPHVGLALLHHFLAQQDHVAGAGLLHQMHVHYGHMLANELQPFTSHFDRMRLTKMPPLPAPSNPPRIGLYRLDRPLWYGGFEDPSWLLPAKAADSKNVVFFALAADGQPKIEAGREDEFARLLRSVPLFLAEHAWLSTPHRGSAVLSLAEHGGWALMGRPWPEEQLLTQVPEAERARTILVTGVVRVEGDKRRIDLWAYDCAQKQRIGHAAAEGTLAELGNMLLQLMAELWPVLGGPKDHKPPVGNEEFWARYAEGLAQQSALVVTQAGGMPKDRLYGERYITGWLQATALAETRWQPGFWLLASSLCVLHQLGSPVPKEHARMIAEIFRQSPANSAFARLAVRPLRAVGLETLWNSRRAEIVAAAGNDPNYMAWLQRAEAAK
jgi:tetratricopeptide (TPR) repeat protein